MQSGAVVDQVASPVRRAPDEWTALGRSVWIALILGWLVLLVALVGLGERQSSYAELRDAVLSGDVSRVQVDGSQVRWRDDLVAHQATAHRRDVAADLRTLRPDVQVDLRSDLGYPSASVYGWGAPGWTVLAALGLLLATLMVNVASPEPWRATRAAWFWLILLGAPVGVPAYLLLAGPTPLVPRPRVGARRLTGGWAFLLTLVIGGVFSGAS